MAEPQIKLSKFQERVMVELYHANEAGRVLNFEELATKLHTSVESISEAMSVLQAVGFVEPNPRTH